MSELEAAVISSYLFRGKTKTRIVTLLYKSLKRFFGPDCDATTIDYTRLMSYAADRMKTRKPATAHNELKYLRLGMVEMEKAGRMRVPIFPRLRVKNARQGFFEDHEFNAVISHIDPELAPLLRFLWFTGWREGETKSLTWANVDFSVGCVRLEVGTTKNEDGRVFPFGVLPPLRTLLEEQRRRTSAIEAHLKQVIPWVFWRVEGKHAKPVHRYERSWKAACLAACYPGKLVHDLRRTAVRRLERAGVPRSVAMKLTGHKTESIYHRYAIVSERDLSEGVAKLATMFRLGEKCHTDG